MTGLVLRDIAIRHQGDDCLSNPAKIEVDIERIRCEWASRDSESGNLFGNNYAAFHRGAPRWGFT